MDDGDSSGDSDSDDGFNEDDPYQPKRRKMNEDETEKRSDWTKAPAFVSGDTVDLDKSIETDEELGEDRMEDDGADEVEGTDESDEEDGSEATDGEFADQSEEPSRVPSPRIREEEDEPLARPRLGGIGSGAADSFSGFKKGGIGSFKPVFTTQPSHSPSPTPESFPSAFGVARAQRSFVRSESPASKPATPLPAHERAHFSKLGGFGAKMMEKMGWQAGMGLGTTGDGIVVPVESKLRPKNMGIAFKGF
jgi:tuftelin-interacting protein 11